MSECAEWARAVRTEIDPPTSWGQRVARLKLWREPTDPGPMAVITVVYQTGRDPDGSPRRLLGLSMRDARSPVPYGPHDEAARHLSQMFGFATDAKIERQSHGLTIEEPLAAAGEA